ncbi:MAG: shikimate dehydrogenase [Chitinophagaceae bacterium]|nr:shikimate dehydrogenase [Chitinophagaceae bacterium]
MPEAFHKTDDDKATKLYGLIGFPLTHSFSKKYFEEKFKQLGLINCRFENFSIQSIYELNSILKKHHAVFKGLAVTIPYKQQVLKFLNSLDDILLEMNACNCIKIVDGKLIGYNTDWIGFEKSFIRHLKSNHKKALVLGNGGAAIAVCFVLKKLGITYEIVSRRIHDGSTFTYTDLTENIIKEHAVIINTTPLGTFPDNVTFPPIPYEGITKEHYLFDLVYNPEKTLFLQKGEEQGATIKNGADMLAIQAEENWKIWNS